MINSVRSLWVGGTLSKIERLSMASFVFHGVPYFLYTYSDVGNVPPGVTVLDANEILPASAIFKDKAGSLGAFSDLFRFNMIKETGDFWVDTDIVCLKPFDFEELDVFGYQDDATINGAVLRLSEHSPVLAEVLDYCSKPNLIREYDSRKIKRKKVLRKIMMQDLSSIKFGEIGPELITSVTKDNGLEHLAKPPFYFYPIHHSCATSIFSEDGAVWENVLKNSYCLHLWNEIFRRHGIDKNGEFSSNSLIGILCNKFLG